MKKRSPRPSPAKEPEPGGEALRHEAADRRQAKKERQAHLWFLESMDQVNRAVQGTNDLEQMMSDVLDVVLAIFDCDRAWLLYPCDPETAVCRIPMERTRPEYPGALALGADIPIDDEGRGILRLVLASAGPVTFGPGSARPVPALPAARFGVRSQIVMAVHPKVDKPYMFGLHQCSHPRAWTPQDQRLFQEIGRRLADALTSLLAYRNLRESESKLAEAQRIAHVGYWDRDIGTDRIGWSDETYRIFGLRPQERVLNLAQLRDLVHPEDRASVLRAIEEALRGGPRYDVEYRVVCPDGEVRFVHSQGDVTWDESGRPRRMFGILQDITDRKRAERALVESHSLLNAVVEGTTDSVYIKDREGRYLLLNAACAGFLGMAVEDVIGKDDRDLFPPDTAAVIMGRDRQVMTSGESQMFEETVTAAGVTRTYLSTKGVYRDPQGQVIGLIGISRDVTALKRMEEQVRQAQKLEAVGRLAGGVAHDFNNLLAVIMSYADLLLDNLEPGDPRREDGEQIRKAAEAAAGLTRQLLAFSRQQALQAKPLDLRTVVTEAEKLLKRLIGEEIELVTVLGGNVGVVAADAGQLQQVIMNLALNARDAMPEGGKLTIEVADAELGEEDVRGPAPARPGRYVVLAVRDTGTGMDDETRAHIFEPFFTTKEVGRGTGLGLATVYGIVTQLNGFIQVESEPGRGATFTIYLPCIDTAA